MPRLLHVNVPTMTPLHSLLEEEEEAEEAEEEEEEEVAVGVLVVHEAVVAVGGEERELSGALLRSIEDLMISLLNGKRLWLLLLL